jgi:hypothetical protein
MVIECVPVPTVAAPIAVPPAVAASVSVLAVGAVLT